MDFDINLVCKGESMEQIPETVLEQTGIYFEDAHFKKDCMAAVSEKIREIDGKFFCHIPFSVVSEAEAFGSKIRSDKNTNGILVDNFKYSNIEQLSSIGEFDFRKGMLSEVLDCIDILSKRGNVVALNVEGPFTILTLLIDNLTIYRALRKKEDIIHNALLTIQDSVRKYIIKGIERGVRIISYSDPSGDIDVIGPAVYKKLSGEITYNLIKSVEDYLDDSIIHLCARTSFPFEKSGFCSSKPIYIKENIKYGEAICRLLGNKNIKILGHKCMNNAGKVLQDPVVWKLDLI